MLGGRSLEGACEFVYEGSPVVCLDSFLENDDHTNDTNDDLGEQLETTTIALQDSKISVAESKDAILPQQLMSPDEKRDRARSDATTSSTACTTSIEVGRSQTFGAERLRAVTTTFSFVGVSSSATSGKRRRDVLNSEQLRSEEVKRLLTFDGSENMLRGSSLSTVLRSCGRIFKNSKGSATTYQLSRVVAGIDSFVSHNWTVPRKTKFLALIYHYFFVRALIGPAILLLVLGFVYCTTDVLPVVIDKAEEYQVGILARVLTIPIFWFTLLFYSDLRAALCGGAGPTVFLDKTCIHQEDASMMQLGISKLGAFIRESKQMLTIFSDEYLRKLWTVYEVASFLTLHPTEDLKMLPTSVPRIVAITVCSSYAMSIFGIFIKMAVPGSMGQFIATSCFAIALLFALRGVSREKASISETIAEFSVKKCTCLCEDDRPVIYANIAVMMRKVLQLDDEMPEDEVLDRFDLLVRTELPQALMEQMGRYVIPMNKIFVVGILFNLPFSIDLIPSHVVDHRPLRSLLVRMFGPVTWAFADTPSVLLVGQWMVMQNIDCRTIFRDRAWTLICLVVFVGMIWLRAAANAQLLSMALKNNFGLLLYIIYFVLSFLQALTLYSFFSSSLL